MAAPEGQALHWLLWQTGLVYKITQEVLFECGYNTGMPQIMKVSFLKRNYFSFLSAMSAFDLPAYNLLSQETYNLAWTPNNVRINLHFREKYLGQMCRRWLPSDKESVGSLCLGR